MKRINKIISLVLTLTMLIGVISGCTSNTANTSTETVSYTDDIGRTVEIPTNIERVASSGAISDVFLYTICPDKMVGFATKFPAMADGFIPQQYLDLPVYGQYYGKNANMNVEALVAADPQIIIDMGEAKDDIAESLDSLQEQSGIPVVFVETSIDSFDTAYEKLGNILNMEDVTAPMAEYCRNTIDMANNNRNKIGDSQQINLYDCDTDILTAVPKDSINGAVIKEVGANNVADFGESNNKKNFNQTSKEQLIQWNPDIILVNSEDAYNDVKSDISLATIDAVQNNKVYMIPQAPYSFLGGPAAVNQIMGIQWLGNLLYPDLYNYDIGQRIKDFYNLFYHCQPTDEQINAMLSSAK